MTRMNHLAAVCFCAGVLGALVHSLSLWLVVVFGMSSWVGIDLNAVMSFVWPYPQLIWGGLWALPLLLFFATPRRRRGWIRKGLWFSLLPSAVHLFYVFPYSTEYGLMGLGMGTFTPLLILFFNALWGASTGIFARLIWGRG